MGCSCDDVVGAIGVPQKAADLLCAQVGRVGTNADDCARGSSYDHASGLSYRCRNSHRNNLMDALSRARLSLDGLSVDDRNHDPR
jgi:hypothetical protein